MKSARKVSNVLLVILLCALLFCANVKAAAHKSVISGNYEQGWRLYDSEEGSGDDYFFRESWIKWKQNLSTQSYYYFKFRLYQTNFANQNQYDSWTIDLSANYTQQITKPIRVKTEVNLREKNYPWNETKRYYEITGDFEVSVKPGKLDQIRCSLKLQHENYPLSDKDNMLSGLTVNWERTLTKKLSIHSGCAFTKENYFSEIILSDKMRYSLSIGFEYQM